jgi:hypothetical protein
MNTWIDAQEKQPAIGKQVIISTESGEACYGKWNGEYWEETEYGSDVEVEYWFPMPKEPK